MTILSNALKYLANSVRFAEHAEFEPEESAALLAEIERLRGFARKILTQERGCDIDGYAVQEWAVDAGLLIVVPVTEACREEGCVCVEYGFPMDCYRLSPLLEESQPMTAPARLTPGQRP